MSYNGSKYCEFCGSLFDFVRSSAKYCSDTCKTKAYNHRVEQIQIENWRKKQESMIRNYHEKYPSYEVANPISAPIPVAKEEPVIKVANPIPAPIPVAKEEQPVIKAEKNKEESTFKDIKPHIRHKRKPLHSHIKPQLDPIVVYGGIALLGVAAVAHLIKNAITGDK